MALAISINLLPIFLTTLAIDLGGLNTEQLGRIGAVTFAGLCVGILLSGPLADRLGPRPFAVGGNLLIALGLAVLATAHSYLLILIACGLMGLGAGMLDMVLSPIVSMLQPDRRTVAMNLLHSFYAIGAVLTILLGAVALRWQIGWRTVSAGLAPMPIVIGLAFLRVALPQLVEKDTVRTPLRSLLRSRYFMVACIAIFLGGSAEMGFSYWMPAYVERTLGYSRWTAGMAFVAFSVAMAVGRIGIMLLPEKVGPLELMLACCIGSSTLFPLASFSPIGSIAIAAAVLAGLTGSCLWPSTLAVAADKFPAGGATMFAVLGMLGNLGGMMMPWLVGFVATQSNLRWGLATATLCPLGMIGALLWMKRSGCIPDGEA